MAQISSSSTIDNKNEKVVQRWFKLGLVTTLEGGSIAANDYDVEKPHGWQHIALLGARDVIRQQKEEIGNLRNQVKALSLENESIGQTPNDSSLICEALKGEVEALNKEVLVLNERSMVYRNVLITSSIGFTVVIGVVMGIMKW
ncbi:unnamed protein product [Eruca vesicaria subsp. sativa]|uniref:DUF7900 domain-containing protein n=1 Tax=Eruca vesicaria subsp. sativa TaxID=29727 RepID=A0ABC8JHQ0_ERUVS|nr:unnamed protein product [Eruca vesicaria subsp. sativa]